MRVFCLKLLDGVGMNGSALLVVLHTRRCFTFVRPHQFQIEFRHDFDEFDAALASFEISLALLFSCAKLTPDVNFVSGRNFNLLKLCRWLLQAKLLSLYSTLELLPVSDCRALGLY